MSINIKVLNLNISEKDKNIDSINEFELDFRKHKDIYYRVWNEVPTCIMIVIVLLITIRPF